MADNYLEKKMEALQARKAKEQRAKQLAWKKRMDAYRKRLEAEKQACSDSDGNVTESSEEAVEGGACATRQGGSV